MSGMKGYKSTCETHLLCGIRFSCIVVYLLKFYSIYEYMNKNTISKGEKLSVAFLSINLIKCIQNTTVK